MAVNARGFQLPGTKPLQLTSNSGGGIRSVYDSAATTQAQDYDDIMGGYDDLINRTKSGQSNPPISSISSNYQPNYQYSRGSDLNRLVGDLQGFSQTGGYSGGDLDNIRARAVSPIRAAYQNAERNLNRQKVLSGGYSPGHGAALAKFAREQGGLMSGAATDANAQIAQMVQQGKLAGLSQLNPLLSQENTLSNQITNKNQDVLAQQAFGNTEDQRNVRDINASQNTRNQAAELQALGGKTSLYGTTPALTNTFGQQVLQNNQQDMNAVSTANQIKNQRANLGLNLVQSQMNRMPTAGGR